MSLEEDLAAERQRIKKLQADVIDWIKREQAVGEIDDITFEEVLQAERQRREQAEEQLAIMAENNAELSNQSAKFALKYNEAKCLLSLADKVIEAGFSINYWAAKQAYIDAAKAGATNLPQPEPKD
jgi:multidrug efflux pump subunit AcrA (membrane-fusion protein)